MQRVCCRLPKGHFAYYQHQDLIHDALVNAWIHAGVEPEAVIGPGALAWNFAALGFHRGKEGRVHSLVITTPTKHLGKALLQLDPTAIHHVRAKTGELFDFATSECTPEPDPIMAGQRSLGVLLLSPLVIRDKTTQGRRWHIDLSRFDPSTAINQRLSRIAGRPVQLRVQADSLYLRANPKHSVLVSLKGQADGSASFVLGMQSPLVLQGTDEDLRLAWYAGIGEKNRSGFGCLGLVERGVGR